MVNDHDPHALDLAIRNGGINVVQASAVALPVDCVDRIIANLPFGKQVGTHQLNQTLYPKFLAEIDRVLAADGRAVLLTEDKRLLQRAIDHQPGLKLARQRLLKYNGATPTAYILSRPRPKQRTSQSPRSREPLDQQTARSQSSPRSSASNDESCTAYS